MENIKELSDTDLNQVSGGETQEVSLHERKQRAGREAAALEKAPAFKAGKSNKEAVK